MCKSFDMQHWSDVIRFLLAKQNVTKENASQCRDTAAVQINLVPAGVIIVLFSADNMRHDFMSCSVNKETNSTSDDLLNVDVCFLFLLFQALHWILHPAWCHTKDGQFIKCSLSERWYLCIFNALPHIYLYNCRYNFKPLTVSVLACRYERCGGLIYLDGLFFAYFRVSGTALFLVWCLDKGNGKIKLTKSWTYRNPLGQQQHISWIKLNSHYNLIWAHICLLQWFL